MAGTIGTYYFDGTSFATATMLYQDATLSTVAPNGYYQQNDIVRQLVGGPGNPVLLQPQACVSCSVPCVIVTGKSIVAVAKLVPSK